MLQRLRAARKNDSGFTLIELLIVIVILGVLAGIVVFAVGAFNDRGEQAACEAERKSVEVAAEAYRAKFNEYPLQGVVGATNAQRLAELVNPEGGATGDGFIRDVPTDPSITLADDGAVGGC